MQTLSFRAAYLDWLRAFALLGIILYTAACPFRLQTIAGIRNSATSPLLEEMCYWLRNGSLQLLFFVAGAAGCCAAGSRSKGKLVLLWIRRLLMPLLAGILLIIPLQLYLEGNIQGHPGCFLQQYRQLVDFQPQGWRHLWVIGYLVLASIGIMPLLQLLKSGVGKPLRYTLQHLATGKRVYLLLPVAVTASIIALPGLPDQAIFPADTATWLYWSLFLLAGMAFMLQPALIESLERNRRYSLVLTAVTTACISCLRHPAATTAMNPGYLQNWLYIVVQPLFTWAWIFTVTGYARRYADKQSPTLDYLNLFALPFYLLQQPVMLIITHYTIKAYNGALLKYSFIVLATYLASFLLFHILIRPFALTRFFFGIKPFAPAIITGKTVKLELPASDFFY